MTHFAISVIDTKSAKLEHEFPINAAHVEAMALEKSGPRLFVNVTDKNYQAVVDRHSGKILARWYIAEAQQNAPIAFEKPNKRLFVVCRAPGKLVVQDSTTGRSVASFPRARGRMRSFSIQCITGSTSLQARAKPAERY